CSMGCGRFQRRRRFVRVDRGVRTPTKELQLPRRKPLQLPRRKRLQRPRRKQLQRPRQKQLQLPLQKQLQRHMTSPCGRCQSLSLFKRESNQRELSPGRTGRTLARRWMACGWLAAAATGFDLGGSVKPCWFRGEAAEGPPGGASRARAPA